MKEVLVFKEQGGIVRLDLDFYREFVSFRVDGTVILRFVGGMEWRKIERITATACCKEYFLSSPLKVLGMEDIRKKVQS